MDLLGTTTRFQAGLQACQRGMLGHPEPTGDRPPVEQAWMPNRTPPPRNARTCQPSVLAVAAAGILVLLVALGHPASSTPAGATDGITLSAAPKWGGVQPGTWTPYTVALHNAGGADIEGEVVLVPQPEPPPKPGARPPDAPAPTSTTVLAVGGRAVTSPPPPGHRAGGGKPRWPTYRAPASLPSGSDKTLTVMVLESPFGYGVELHDRDGRRVASGPGPASASKDHTAVLLLSTVVGAEATLEALPNQRLSKLDVVQPPARELPDDALHLAGLDSVVIDDFDTSTLNAAQLQALQQYVSLGGSLVVTGGAAGSKTLGAMPAGLTPLRATGSTTASLIPLAELLSQSTNATTTVVTGEVRAGRAVLGAPDAPALVVEADYGAGRVVQLAYDPLAEPITSDQVLRGAAWDQGLARVGSRFGVPAGFVSTPSPRTVPEDQVWGPTLVERPWPGWPRWQLGLLVLYTLIAGPATLVLSRRYRPAVARTAVATLVTLTAAAGLGAATVRADTAEAVLQVRVLGADGSVLTTSYRGFAALSPAEHVGLTGAAAASTLYSDHPVFAPARGATALDPSAPQPPLPPGLGQGSVQARGGSPGLRLPARPWALRTVQTLSVTGGGPAIEAALGVAGASKESPGRVTGKVTNRGSEPLRDLRAQIPAGQARLPARLAPGETAQVDAPILALTSSAGGTNATTKLAASTPEDAAMFAVASRSFTAPGQIAIVGMADPTVAKHGRAHPAVVVAVAGLTCADTVLAGSGGGRMVTASLSLGGTSYGAFDAAVPPGTGPLSLRYGAALSLPGQPPPPAASVEIYRWATGTWRSLPTTGHPHVVWVDTPVDDAEVNNGLVRVRERIGPGGRLPGAQLLLRSTSEESEAALAGLIPK